MNGWLDGWFETRQPDEIFENNITFCNDTHPSIIYSVYAMQVCKGLVPISEKYLDKSLKNNISFLTFNLLWLILNN